MQDVVTYPQLNMASLREKRDHEYSLWLLARALDPAGSGRVALEQLYSAAGPFVSRRLVQLRLRQGDGAFWHLRTDAQGKRCLWLVGERQVSELLGAVARHRCSMPLADLFDVSKRRAFFVQSWLAARRMYRAGNVYKPNPVSQSTLAHLAGCSRGTIHNRVKGCARQWGAIRIDCNPYAPIPHDLREKGYFRSTVDGRPVVLKRAASTYFPSMVAARRTARGRSSPLSRGGALVRVWFANRSGDYAGVVNHLDIGRIALTDTLATDDMGYRLFEHFEATKAEAGSMLPKEVQLW